MIKPDRQNHSHSLSICPLLSPNKIPAHTFVCNSFFTFLRIWLELEFQVGFFAGKRPCRTIRPTNRSHQVHVHDMIYAMLNLEQLKADNYFHFHFAWKQKRTRTTLSVHEQYCNMFMLYGCILILWTQKVANSLLSWYV